MSHTQALLSLKLDVDVYQIFEIFIIHCLLSSARKRVEVRFNQHYVQNFFMPTNTSLSYLVVFLMFMYVL